MARQAHHRADYRVGPHHAWVRRKTYHLNKILRLAHASHRMARSMRCVSPGVYQIPAADRLAWLNALEDAWFYACDESGEVWR